MKRLIPLIIVVAAMAGAAYGLTLFVVLPRFGPMAGASSGSGSKAPSAHEEKGGHGEENAKGEVYLVSNLLVNPTGTSGTRYLSATIGFEVKAPETAEKLRTRDVQVRDLLLSILSARTVEELTDFQSRDQMRQEILGRMNQMLGGDELAAVYFVDYVLQ